jgi:hypothetical protein
VTDRRLDVARVLSVVAAWSAALLGGLMLIGGVGLAFAVATSTQLPLQFATAGMLIVTGAVNLWASRHLRTDGRALAASAVATLALIVYLGVIGDVGEPLLLHVIFLSMLAGLRINHGEHGHRAQPAQAVDSRNLP